MGKMLYVLSVCSLSSFLFANPLETIHDKKLFAACALEYCKANPCAVLTIQNLTKDKASLVRQVSDIALSLDDLSLKNPEKELIHRLAEQDCPVPTTPKTKAQDCPIPDTPHAVTESFSQDNSPQIRMHKRKKVVLIDTITSDCIVKNSPPPSPKTKRRVIEHNALENISKRVNIMHRQWSSKWNSDSDLQNMLEESLCKQGVRTRRKSYQA